jgi:hypothetical protein
MKLLVSGCSFSSGWGFTESNIEKSWPRLLAKKLNATLTNVSQTGYDNSGILLNFLEQLTKEDFDVCLLQLTNIDRILLSPNWYNRGIPRLDNMSNGFLNDHEYQSFYKGFVLLNQHSEHWNRLLKLINIIQNLVKQGKYIRFVNGLLDWDQSLFVDPPKSKFLDRLIDIDHIPDNQVDELRTLVYNQTESIDLNLWINSFNSLNAIKVDNISSTDTHPGLLSHEIYANLIFNYLKDNTNA